MLIEYPHHGKTEANETYQEPVGVDMVFLRTFRARVDDVRQGRMVKVQETLVLGYEAPILWMAYNLGPQHEVATMAEAAHLSTPYHRT